MNGNLTSRTLESAEVPAPKPRPRMKPSLTAPSRCRGLRTLTPSRRPAARQLFSGNGSTEIVLATMYY
ncbi:hypothetical protein KC356_g250 [Hortaea werneckii]|nr:hypothetical protein KC356_g250 [Hortaea werneckii]